MAVMTFLFQPTNAQKPDDIAADTVVLKYSAKRGRIIGIGVGSVYVASFASLYSVWYKDYPQSNFHFFNDWNEWNQLDKFGHFGSAYYLSRWGTSLVRWTGYSPKKSAILGTGMGYLFQTTIEVMDGFSSKWGFSPGDVLANTTAA